MRLWLWSAFSLSLFWKYLEQGRLNVAWFQFAIICTEEWSSSEIIKYFYSLKSQKHKLSLPTNNHHILKLYKKERRTKPCCCQVVQISLLCALAGQMAGDDNSGHDSHCHPQNLRALLPLQIIADEVCELEYFTLGSHLILVLALNTEQGQTISKSFFLIQL